MKRPARRPGAWLRLLLACRYAPSVEQSPRPPSFGRLDADERAESVAIERRVHKLSFHESLISLEVHHWFANSVSWAGRRMDRHGVTIAAGRFFHRPRYRDRVVTSYVIDAESAARSECEDAPHSPLCMRLRGARGTCAPVGPRAIACDDAFFSRILVWAASDAVVEALNEPDKASAQSRRIHEAYAAIERIPDPEQRALERMRYAKMVGADFFDHDGLAARLTAMLLVVYAHEVGHLVLGHDIDGYGDVAQAERAADEFAYAAIRARPEFLGLGASSYVRSARRSRLVHFFFDAFNPPEPADPAAGSAEQSDQRRARVMRRVAGCDVSHGTLSGRFAGLLKLAAAQQGPYAAEFQEMLESIQWLVQAEENICAEYPTAGSVDRPPPRSR